MQVYEATIWAKKLGSDKPMQTKHASNDLYNETLQTIFFKINVITFKLNIIMTLI